MTERVHSGYYSCLRLFLADFRRIILNCRSYNERGTEYYKCAANLEKFFMTKLKSLGLWYDLNAWHEEKNRSHSDVYVVSF